MLGKRLGDECKTVTCVSERRVNFKSTWGVFEETLAERSFDTGTFAQKHRELRCGQASTLTP